MIMKALIGAACIAVIAFVGYFFWSEYNRSQIRAHNAQVRLEQFKEDYCERISRYSAKYDNDYTVSLGYEEVMRRYRMCNEFIATGKIPQ